MGSRSGCSHPAPSLCLFFLPSSGCHRVREAGLGCPLFGGVALCGCCLALAWQLALAWHVAGAFGDCYAVLLAPSWLVVSGLSRSGHFAAFSEAALLATSCPHRPPTGPSRIFPQRFCAPVAFSPVASALFCPSVCRRRLIRSSEHREIRDGSGVWRWATLGADGRKDSRSGEFAFLS